MKRQETTLEGNVLLSLFSKLPDLPVQFVIIMISPNSPYERSLIVSLGFLWYEPVLVSVSLQSYDRFRFYANYN